MCCKNFKSMVIYVHTEKVLRWCSETISSARNLDSIAHTGFRKCCADTSKREDEWESEDPKENTYLRARYKHSDLQSKYL